MSTLQGLLRRSARRHPDRVAVEDPARGAAVTFRELDQLSEKVSRRLLRRGIAAGDRIGLCASKSIASVAAIFGILKAGAAYVPVDASVPTRRRAFIFEDCQVRAIIAEPKVSGGNESRQGNEPRRSREGLDLPHDLSEPLVLEWCSAIDGPAEAVPRNLSYVLYTSGSTGNPKGVMHTHTSALSFVDWCSEVFAPTPEDVFSSHAPFHFDLSILDIYVPLKHGAKLVLIGEETGKHPTGLARLIGGRQLTVWYSTPSILRLLLQYGQLESHDCSSLRLALFAGEVFPVKYLRRLTEIWPQAAFYNLYGPTETNVCTWYRIPDRIPASRTQPFPIGRVCGNDTARVVDENGSEVERGREGELQVWGGSVMQGYWNLPERNAEAFAGGESAPWYRTGDVVREMGDGIYEFVGRRDRMVKRRGYRVELGEIEAGLYRHRRIQEAAVVALPDEEDGVQIHAFLSWSGDQRPSLLEMKRFCAENLPLYMIPDRFFFQSSLPKTSTDKIDYQRLVNLGA